MALVLYYVTGGTEFCLPFCEPVRMLPARLEFKLLLHSPSLARVSVAATAVAIHTSLARVIPFTAGPTATACPRAGQDVRVQLALVSCEEKRKWKPKV